MELNRKSIILLGVGALLAIGLVIALIPNEERRVRKTFERVAELINKEPDEPMLATAAKARGLGDLTTQSFHLEAREIGMNQKFDPDTVAQCAAMMRAHERHIAVTFSDLSVDFPAEKDHVAQVLGNVKIDADHNLGFKGKEARTFEVSLKKDAETGTWKFSQVKVHRVN